MESLDLHGNTKEFQPISFKKKKVGTVGSNWIWEWKDYNKSQCFLPLILSKGKFQPCQAGWIPWLKIFFCNLLFNVSFSIYPRFQSTCQSGPMKGFTRRFQAFNLCCRQSQNLHAFGTKLCLGNVFRRAGKSAAAKLTILLVDYTYDKTVILVQTKSYQGS